MRPSALALALVLGLPGLVSLVLACTVEPVGDDEPAAADEPAADELAHTGSETSGGSGEISGESTSGESTTGSDCIPTALGCECGPDESCAPGLACVAGVCEFVGCEPGSLNCACLPDHTCSLEWLSCEAGVCEYTCTLGSAGCECPPRGCNDGLECIEGECWQPSAYPNCGWNDEDHWYACGSSVAFPWIAFTCPEIELVAGAPCPMEPGMDVTTIGCCDLDGNNWWCEGGVLAFDDCSDAP